MKLKRRVSRVILLTLFGQIIRVKYLMLQHLDHGLLPLLCLKYLCYRSFRPWVASFALFEMPLLPQL